MWERTIKTIPLSDCTMHAIINDRRYDYFECDANIELVEQSIGAPVLGKGRIVTGYEVLVIVTYNHHKIKELDPKKISQFDLTGDIVMENTRRKQITFKDCKLESDLNLTEDSSCTFSVMCTKERVRELKTI